MKIRKIKHYLWAFLGLGLLLGACTRETITEEPEIGPEGEGMFAVSLQIDPLTRGIATGADVLAEETHVEAVRVVLYNTGNNPTVQYAFDFDIKTPATPATQAPYFEAPDNTGPGGGKNLYSAEQENRFVTWAQKVKKQDYQMLVIVNPPGDGEDTDTTNPSNLLYRTKPGQPLSLLTTPVEIEDADDVSQDNYFTMMNYRGLVSVPASSLGTSETAAHNSPVAASVERMVAKIVVTVEGQTVPQGAAMGGPADLQWEPDRTNRYTYWMRNMTYPEGGYNGPVETVADYMDGKTYAEDPNYTGLFGDGTNFNRVVDFYGVYDPELAYEDGDIQYVLENTLVPSEVANKRFTTVIVRIPYTPDVDNIPLGDSYYTFGDVWYDVSAMQTLANMFIGSPSGNLGEIIDDLYNEAGIDLRNPQTASFSYKGLNYYHEGISYYTVPLRHFALGTEGIATYGYYGVVRNNIYKVYINGANGPGSPTLEEPVYLSAEVGVMPWYGTEQTEEIGDKPKTLVTYEYYYEDWYQPDPVRALPDRKRDKLLKTDYVTNLELGAEIPITREILDRYLDEANRLGTYVYTEGVLLEAPTSSTVTYDPAENVVQIIYKKVRALHIINATAEVSQWGSEGLALPFQVTKIIIGTSGGEQFNLADYKANPADYDLGEYREHLGVFQTKKEYAQTFPFDAAEPLGQEIITTEAGESDIYYVHVYLKEMEQSDPPTIDTISDGSWIVYGDGIGGSTVTVIFPNGATGVTQVSWGYATWGIQSPVQLRGGETVRAYQTEPWKTPSIEVSAIVRRNE